ncbi:MAG TPA: hypothetical protein VJR88_11955 [Novosphingobium sp.]|nr:hypothetical protein [Novosphingobium sp.]
MVHVGRRLSCDQIGHIVSAYSRRSKYLGNFARWVSYHLSRERFMISDFRLRGCFGRQRFACFLECMTERPVPNVMQQCGEQGDFGSRLIELASNALQFNLASDDPDKTSCVVEDADRMRKSGVTCGWKYELGNAELLDAPKTLHFDGAEQCPNCLIDQSVVVEDDETVNWVSDALGLFHLEQM